MALTQPEKDLRHNLVVNVLDGAFFGMGIGFASAVTVIPLFVNTLTDSTTLIGLIVAIQLIGWQLPQLLTAKLVAGLRRYKPTVLWMTLHERWPYLGLAVVALFATELGAELALLLTFLFFGWHAMGGGFTATAWQSMISKIMPEARRGVFFGLQSAGFNLLSGLAAVLAGLILVAVPYPYNFALCFFLTSVAMLVSFIFLALTREEARDVPVSRPEESGFWNNLRDILRRDANFRWFVVARILFQLVFTAVSFYTIYGVRQFGLDEATAGVLGGLLLFTQVGAGPRVGWAGDRWGHRRMFALGALGMSASALLALAAPGIGWFYPIFILAGVANAVQFITIISMTVEFGGDRQRPYYIGLANTLVAPATIVAPLLGGWLADTFGFEALFGACVGAGVLAILVLLAIVDDPRRLRTPLPASAPVD